MLKLQNFSVSKNEVDFENIIQLYDNLNSIGFNYNRTVNIDWSIFDFNTFSLMMFDKVNSSVRAIGMRCVDTFTKKIDVKDFQYAALTCNTNVDKLALCMAYCVQLSETFNQNMTEECIKNLKLKLSILCPPVSKNVLILNIR